MGEEVPPQVTKVTRKTRWFLLALLFVIGGGVVWSAGPSPAPLTDDPMLIEGACETHTQCTDGEFCRLGLCASWTPEFTCTADAECMLIDSTLRFGDAVHGVCSTSDVSSTTWIAVNKVWYEKGKNDYCTVSEGCSQAEKCDTPSTPSLFVAQCVEQRCEKAPAPPPSPKKKR